MKSIIFMVYKFATNLVLVFALAYLSKLPVDTVLLWMLFGYVIYVDTKAHYKNLP